MSAAEVSFGIGQTSVAVAAAPCAHCGLDVPSGLIEADAPQQFCCTGCRTAYAILNEHGLGAYYTFADRREEPVRASGRTYEEFDHPAFRELYVKPLPGGLAQVELYLEGVHCASCVWLVERMPIVIPGVLQTELEIRRSRARVVWEPASLPLSSIARTLDSLGYPPHPFRGAARDEIRRREDRAMLVRIGVAGAIAANVMLAAAALYSGWGGGIEHQYAQFFRWISLGLVTPALIWPGRVFFNGAWAALRTRTLHMDVPIAIGLAAGYAQGAFNTVRGDGPIYFDGVATLIFALLIGRYVQQRGQRAATDSAELLFSLTPHTAHVVAEDGSISDVPASALLPGMTIETRAGEAFAADGVIESGTTNVDTSLLTGESRPMSLATGDRVYAGSLNVASPVRVHVEEAGETSRVATIMRQVEESAARRAPVVQLANRTAAYFVGVVLALAVVTFALWWHIDRTRAVDSAIALLIVTCPCALALSTPLAVSMTIGRAAREGIFIKGGDALERLATPGTLFLDKTGTITQSRTALVAWNGDEWVKPLVLALEAGSTHPIASAFRGAWSAIVPPVATDTEHVLAGGIMGTVGEARVVIGSPAFVRDLARVDGAVPQIDDALTPVWIAVDGRVVAVAGIGDPVRADAASSIAMLRADGWLVRVLSGDAPSVVRAVARSVGVPEDAAVGGASPEAKRAAIDAARGARAVVMVGDGINDAAAMAAASVGIGVHGGAEACLASADIYMTTPGLQSLVRLTRAARRTLRVIQANVAWALVYNAIGAGLAMSGRLTPLAAAVLMPASSLTVVLTSWRARAFRKEV